MGADDVEALIGPTRSIVAHHHPRLQNLGCNPFHNSVCQIFMVEMSALKQSAVHRQWACTGA
jgi:hypothetical protein